jgi:AraC-like DNA-binding protein
MDVLSTDLLEPARRFAFWSEVVCRTFTKLDCRTADRARFRAKLCSRCIGEISVARVEATSSGVTRTTNLIRSNHDDAHIVMLQISGAARVLQGEHSCSMAPGELDIVQADRPYVLDFPGSFSQYVIKLPRSTQPVGAAISATAARLVRSLSRELLDPDVEPDVICDEVAVRAIEAMLCGQSQPSMPCGHYADVYSAAIAVIREKMFEPLMGRDHVANELGVSVRTLARSFARHGTTFDRSLWNCRLEAAYESLLSHRSGASVTEVALRYGFSDSSHFTRRFKARYGVTPGSLLMRH